MTVEELMGALINHTDEHYGSIRKTVGNNRCAGGKPSCFVE